MAAFVSIGIVFFIYFLIFVVAAGSQLLLAFCVYYDAKLHGNQEAKMWAILSGFFNVAALIYLLMRGDNKKKPVQCPACFAWLSADYRTCARCGHPREEKGNPILEETYRRWEKHRKTLFIWWIVSMALPVLLAIVWVFFIVIAMLLGISAEYMSFLIF